MAFQDTTRRTVPMGLLALTATVRKEDRAGVLVHENDICCVTDDAGGDPFEDYHRSDGCTCVRASYNDNERIFAGVAMSDAVMRGGADGGERLPALQVGLAILGAVDVSMDAEDGDDNVRPVVGDLVMPGRGRARGGEARYVAVKAKRGGDGRMRGTPFGRVIGITGHGKNQRARVLIGAVPDKLDDDLSVGGRYVGHSGDSRHSESRAREEYSESGFPSRDSSRHSRHSESRAREDHWASGFPSRDSSRQSSESAASTVGRDFWGLGGPRLANPLAAGILEVFERHNRGMPADANPRSNEKRAVRDRPADPAGSADHMGNAPSGEEIDNDDYLRRIARMTEVATEEAPLDRLRAEIRAIPGGPGLVQSLEGAAQAAAMRHAARAHGERTQTQDTSTIGWTIHRNQTDEFRDALRKGIIAAKEKGGLRSGQASMAMHAYNEPQRSGTSAPKGAEGDAEGDTEEDTGEAANVAANEDPNEDPNEAHKEESDEESDKESDEESDKESDEESDKESDDDAKEDPSG
jgi:hypothetical protein